MKILFKKDDFTREKKSLFILEVHTKVVSQSTYQLLTWCENDDVEKCHVKP